MSGKPTQQEQEYFARLELEQRRRGVAERERRQIRVVAQERSAKWAPPVAEDTGVLGSLRRIFTYA